MLRLIKYVKNYYFSIVLAAVACMGASASTVMLTDVLKHFVDRDVSNTMWQIFLILAIGVCSNYLVIYTTGYIGAGLLRDLRADCVQGLMQAAPVHINSYSRGDIMERVESDVEGLAEFIQGYFKDCLYVPIMGLVYAVYLFRMDAVLASFCLVPLMILVPLNVRYRKPIKLMQFAYNQEMGLTNNRIQEVFDGAATIKAYNLQERMEKKYYVALHRLLKISNDTDRKQYHLEPISRAIQELPVAIALILGGFSVLGGKITLGVLIAYISILRKLVDPLSMCYQLVVRTQTAIVAVTRVFEIIDMPKERKGESVEEKPQLLTAIKFESVSFRYGTDEEKVLRNISLEIPQGSHVAFVGRSGSGKSTILKLIATFLEPDEGRIKLFDRDYKTLCPEQVRQKLAYVSQDDILFPLSVEENVRVGNPGASKEQIKEAIRKAGCENFADVILAERGSNLSGGQRQRLAMARAIVKDADIYLFDEPTSALDDETERIICCTIEALPKDKTVITVTHRPSTIQNYDLVYAVENGQIIRLEGGEDERT